MQLLAVSLCFLIAGCASTSEVVYLAKGGQRVQCGPYEERAFGVRQEMASGARMENRLRDCVADYQRQGYERVPNP